MDNSVKFRTVNGSLMEVACDNLDAVKITGSSNGKYVQLYYSEIQDSPSYQLCEDETVDNFRNPSFDMEGDVENGVIFYKKDRVLSMEDTGRNVWITLKSSNKFKVVK